MNRRVVKDVMIYMYIYAMEYYGAIMELCSS